MAQANPQFTPVQILEAGERALADGRSEYAAQFFQHLIEHYSAAPEAASARDAMARLNGSAVAPQYANGHATNGHGPAEPAYRNGQDQLLTAPPAPTYAPQASPSRPPNGAGQANGHANGQVNDHLSGMANDVSHPGQAAPGQPAPGHAPILQPIEPIQRQRNEPAFGRPPQAREMPNDPMHDDHVMPRHLARHGEPRGAAVNNASQRLFAPAPEKNYIIGRVISGLLLLIGIAGIFAGIVLVYGAISDPRLFARIGMELPAQALIFSLSVFIGSIVMLIISQVATALFDGADAAADLARLERYRMGDGAEEE